MTSIKASRGLQLWQLINDWLSANGQGSNCKRVHPVGLCFHYGKSTVAASQLWRRFHNCNGLADIKDLKIGKTIFGKLAEKSPQFVNLFWWTIVPKFGPCFLLLAKAQTSNLLADTNFMSRHPHLFLDFSSFPIFTKFHLYCESRTYSSHKLELIQSLCWEILLVLPVRD